MIYFGVRLKELRKGKNLTQQQLADRMSLVKSSISAYEKSAKYPSIEVLVKLCHYFNVSADYLLGLSDNKTIKDYNLTEEQIEIVMKIIVQFHKLNNQKYK